MEAEQVVCSSTLMRSNSLHVNQLKFSLQIKKTWQSNIQAQAYLLFYISHRERHSIQLHFFTIQQTPKVPLKMAPKAVVFRTIEPVSLDFLQSLSVFDLLKSASAKIVIFQCLADQLFASAFGF